MSTLGRLSKILGSVDDLRLHLLVEGESSPSEVHMVQTT